MITEYEYEDPDAPQEPATPYRDPARRPDPQWIADLKGKLRAREAKQEKRALFWKRVGYLMSGATLAYQVVHWWLHP